MEQLVILSDGQTASLIADATEYQQTMEAQRDSYCCSVEVIENNGISIQCLEYDRHGCCLTPSHGQQFDIVEIIN